MAEDTATLEAAPGNPGAKRGRPHAHRVSWGVLAVSTVAILMTSVDRVILPTVLPAIIDEFELTLGQANQLLFWNGIGTLVGAFLLGAFGDVLGKGPRRAWVWSATVVVTIVAGIATFFNSTFGQLKVWRFIMGTGTGGMEPVNVALLSDWWQKEDRGFAVGVHHTGFPIGQFVGPLLIGGVLALAGWREAFLLIPLVGVPIVIWQMTLARRKKLVAANTWMREQGLTPSAEEDEPAHFTSPVSAVAEALRSRNVMLAVVVAFLLILCEFGVANYLTLQLSERPIGMSLSYAAIVSGASGLTGWIGQIAWGTFSDRIGRRRALFIIVIGWVVTLAALTLISGSVSAWLLLMFWGVFRNSPFPVLYALLIDTIPGAAAAGMGVMIGVAVGLSQVLSAVVSGNLVEAFGYDVNYLVLAGIALLGLIPVFLMKETVRRA